MSICLSVLPFFETQRALPFANGAQGRSEP